DGAPTRPYAGGGACDVYKWKLYKSSPVGTLTIPVAIKTLRCLSQSRTEAEVKAKLPKRAAKELLTWLQLDHPNILPLLGLAIFNDGLSMVSPWMSNGNLSEYLRKNKNSTADRIAFCEQIRAGLVYIHGKNMVHGDLKAVNIMVSRRGTVMITDFGNAMLKDLALLFAPTTTFGMTYQYAPPELLTAQQTPVATKESDVYSFGMEILSGEIPFLGKLPSWLVMQASQRKLVLSQPSTIDDDMWSILLACWAYDPSKRPHISSIRFPGFVYGHIPKVERPRTLPHEPPSLSFYLLTKAFGVFSASIKYLNYEGRLPASKHPAQDDSPQKLYGLIIGVDTYSNPSLDDLTGAVRGSNDVAEFLIDLGVPAEHIVRLYNEQATRGRILEELKTLWENPNIQHGDPILIYYSGHGGLVPANTAWKERYGAGTIQVIFPYDYGCEVLGPTKPTKVDYIRDTTIALMLNRLAIKKGDNIIVIFDCHHAVNFGPKLTSQDRRHQNAEARSEIPNDTDDNFAVLDDFESILFIKQQYHAELSLYTDGNPYIFLAACQADQNDTGKGLFTAELLKKMRESRVDDITYHDLMKSLEMLETLGRKATASVVPVPLPADNEEIKVDKIKAKKLHALIIGINDYPNLPRLKGAVADADEVVKFLESELKIPPDHIINLRDDTATRQNIINSIKSFQNNPRINRGDPILIYYAGNGGVRRATEEWREQNGANIVQVIFPFDYDNKGDTSKPIECIPDRTIAGLLNDLSQAKGDNITVIFDSCHWASGTRVPNKPRKGVLDRRERAAEVKRDIPWDIDHDIIRPAPPWRGNETHYTRWSLCTNQTSHIHLAACGSEEKAYEENGRGVFTMALLKSIRANGVDKITYHSLIKSLPSLSSQSPHCYGKHKQRILFDSSVPSQGTLTIPVKFEAENKDIVLQAGAASGVSTESIWEIYASVTDEVPLGSFRAEPPHVSTTVLQPEEEGGDGLFLAHMSKEGSGTRTYARQVRVGVIDELLVYFTPRAKERIFPKNEIDPALSYPVGSGERDVGYVHAAEDSADIAVDLHDSDGRVSFRLCDRQAGQYGVATLENRVRAERSAVDEVLFGAAKWKWHLQRKNTDSWQITDPVKMELIKVGVKRGPHKIMFPVEEREVMNESGIVDFEVDRRDLYGVQLTSQVDQPLYIRMFYFDTTDFSIVDMFGHATVNDPAILPKGTFLIGDKAEGGTPLQFTLNKDQKVDLGYLKVFWSTEPIEMEGLGQKPTFNRGPPEWSRPRGCKLDDDANEGIEWGTLLLTLVQRLPDTTNFAKKGKAYEKAYERRYRTKLFAEYTN
ncbi:hypothetical protein FRC11_006569, partial [Ceratobasidium sp. 423]